MEAYNNIKEQILSEGFAVIDNIFSNEEIDHLVTIISKADSTNLTFRKTNDLFAIRQFFKEVPESVDLIFNSKLRTIIATIFGNDFFIVKSIYFDKPGASNWFVAYHQDLTISVDKKVILEGYGPWTTKQHQFAVQPPLHILQDNFTIRIHLDETNENNGALKVIPKSHLKGIYRTETINRTIETENTCTVKKGGIMLMKPLLLHASARTINNNKRRVVHIEFSRSGLPTGIKWAEYNAALAQVDTAQLNKI